VQCIRGPGIRQDRYEYGYLCAGAKENIGYARGNNLGVEFLASHFDVEYLLFSNNDIVFQDEDVVERLVDKLEAVKDAGLIGPSIRNLEGEKQNPYVRPSIWKQLVIPWLFMPFLIMMKKTGISNAVDTKAQEGYCYRLSGSFMLTRADVFLKAGMFDRQTFLYCEEPILSERYLRVGFKTYYYDGVSVVHEHGHTSSRVHSYLQTKKIDLDSQLYYFQKYRSVSSVVIYLAKASFSIYANIWHPLIDYLLRIRDSRRKVQDV
jgi:GT2 family glycosyltransferase